MWHLFQESLLRCEFFNGAIGNVSAAGSDAIDPGIPLFVSLAAANACGVSAPTPVLSLAPGGGTIACVPDAQTLCLFDGRFSVTANQLLPNGSTIPAIVTRRFNDGGGFGLRSATTEDLFVRAINL